MFLWIGVFLDEILYFISVFIFQIFGYCDFVWQDAKYCVSTWVLFHVWVLFVVFWGLLFCLVRREASRLYGIYLILLVISLMSKFGYSAIVVKLMPPLDANEPLTCIHFGLQADDKSSNMVFTICSLNIFCSL